ncbi:MAG: hypothetical protein IPK48_06785 [Gammaproteobacteria bacterium]|nr:hypothetical protein [Gammaproteobacteria bacterium]
MRVLVACEYSGRVRRAFQALGHDAWSADFEPAEDGSPNHYQGDCFDLIGSHHFDLMVAHPPCTYLSVSGMHWTTRGLRDPQLTEDALAFVWRLMSAPIAKIAVENPVSIISTRIRKPDQTINPYQFGEDASKKTCLWLKGLPPLIPTDFVAPRMVCCGSVVPGGDKYGCPICNGAKVARPRWGNQCDSGQNKLGPSDTRWKERSRTYEGIAHAMATQWGSD